MPNHAVAALACVVLLSSAGAPDSALAQQPNQNQRPPVSIKGWRHDNSPLGLHTFSCDKPACPSSSRLVYKLHPPTLYISWEHYRHHAEPLNAADDERAADANFMQFAAPLWMLADDKLESQR